MLVDSLKELHTAIQLAESKEERKAILDQARRLLSVLVEADSIPHEILEQWDKIQP